MSRPPITDYLEIEDRFWRKAEIIDPAFCWIWNAGRDHDGYGVASVRLRVNDIRLQRAPRIAWALHHGCSAPSDRLVLHRCDNRACVNPHHLFLGTHYYNAQDRDQKGRGCRTGNAKLTADLADKIRRLYRAGDITQRALAERFRVSRPAISNIISGRSWREVV